jgi:hypothetical protein
MWHTDKKENKIFLIYKESQKGAVAKSYTRKGLQIYEEMREFLVIYEEAIIYIWGKFYFPFYQYINPAHIISESVLYGQSSG